MIKQNKGKDIHKIPSSKLSLGPYYCSIKYDGHYTQIHYAGSGGKVQFFTSGGKEFYITQMAEFIKETFANPFKIECEYNYYCDGKLGDRGKSAMLTTYRTKFQKGFPQKGSPYKDTFRILDLIDSKLPFGNRLTVIHDMFESGPWFSLPMQKLVRNFDDGKELAKAYVERGYEGAMLKHQNHIYQPGKRTNDIIKLKPRKTADLRCIGYKEGTGKYEGMVGALLLEDEEGVTVWAGSGLSDVERSIPGHQFICRVYEIEYERIDETYIQPVIKHRREDKE